MRCNTNITIPGSTIHCTYNQAYLVYHPFWNLSGQWLSNYVSSSNSCPINTSQIDTAYLKVCLVFFVLAVASFLNDDTSILLGGTHMLADNITKYSGGGQQVYYAKMFLVSKHTGLVWTNIQNVLKLST